MSNSTTTTVASATTIPLIVSFGQKNDEIWESFLGVICVALLFDVALSVLFVFKTVYRPTKIFKPRQPRAMGAKNKTKQFGTDPPKKPPTRHKDHGVVFDAAELGTVSSSNSEEESKYRNKNGGGDDVVGVELIEITTEEQPAAAASPEVDGEASSASASPENRQSLSQEAGIGIEMDIPFERISCGRRIGKGGVGSVYAGELQGVGPVALKKVSVVGEERLQDLAQEAKMLAALRHEHIVFLHGLAISPEEEIGVGGRIDRNAYLVMELCAGDVGSLLDESPKLKDKDQPSGAGGGIYFSDRVVLLQKIAQQVAATMEFVHSRDVVHRDLKPANVLLTDNKDIRIADFGLSKALSNDQNHQTMEIGTPAYMAPELIVGIQDEAECEAVITAPKALDVYAFGILLWALFMDMHPYPKLGAFQTIYQVKMCNLRPEIPDAASTTMKNLLQRCWALEPKDRPSFREINLALAAIIEAGDWIIQDAKAKIFVD